MRLYAVHVLLQNVAIAVPVYTRRAQPVHQPNRTPHEELCVYAPCTGAAAKPYTPRGTMCIRAVHRRSSQTVYPMRNYVYTRRAQAQQPNRIPHEQLCDWAGYDQLQANYLALTPWPKGNHLHCVQFRSVQFSSVQFSLVQFSSNRVHNTQPPPLALHG